MFSKLTMSLAMTISLMLASNAMAQTTKKKADPKKATEAKALEAKKAEEARLAEAAKKAEEEKALEAKRAEEAKLAAEKSKEEDQASIWGYLKSHFSASYHGEYYFTRKDLTSSNKEDYDIQDLRIMHNPTIIYRPVKNWKILATSEFKYTDATVLRGTYINRHYRSLVLISRENVLTEKENGIKMDIGVGRRIFDRNHGKAAGYGNSRINTSLSKKFGDNLSTSLLVQYLANDPAKGKITQYTWKHSLELIPSFTFQITDKLSYFFNDDIVINTPWYGDTSKDIDFSHEMNIGVVSYQFNDKNSAYFQFKYLHFSYAPFDKAPDVNDWFEYYIGHTYSFTPKVSLTGEIGSKIFAGSDGRDFFAKNIKYPEFALYFDVAL